MAALSAKQIKLAQYLADCANHNYSTVPQGVLPILLPEKSRNALFLCKNIEMILKTARIWWPPGIWQLRWSENGKIVFMEMVCDYDLGAKFIEP